MKGQIVNTIRDGIDNDNYIYLLCDCIVIPEAIKYPRPEYSAYIRTICPRCGEQIGMIILGKVERREGKCLGL